MHAVRVYSSLMCPYCVMAKRLLDDKGVRYEDLRVDRDPGLREEMMRITGRRTVPQIFVGETHVGGFDDLSALDRAGKLDPLLQGG
ncbi:glutaredoxin 3 [Panacagrimonas perspica]|uniref:Glutaredoxin n=1 Tax=Panacagrimonas perspica TaxID=381431 RepID=A0A4R7P3Q2_9GAMM|nr:glutaredoxin 3 [Panacagrimonas perspica]TDU28052.1 glutaredoxin 3 [Panacagrimonas perspica]THD03469.1 glutaredoxin 3 [Panacagrimonas perspica]